MKQSIWKFLKIYMLFTLFFIVMKPVFIAAYLAKIHPTAIDWGRVIFHGFSMDLSVAAYLTIFPGILLSISQLFPKLNAGRILNGYMIAVLFIISFLYTLDLGLYGSWGFRLDATPFFYIFTSPASAMASLQWWHWPAALMSIALLFLLLYLPYRKWIAPAETPTPNPLQQKRIIAAGALLMMTGALILPIRGSITVSTMNPSRAYFSTVQPLNHAALNPIFSLLYSATHQANFDKQYRFMTNEEADSTLRSLLYLHSPSAQPAASVQPTLSSSRPQIVFIILESFSAHLLPSLGGENIAPGLDSLAREGISFQNFYASSFRTDRALASILSSFPAPTNTSLLKYVDKFENLPSLPGELKRQGNYTLNYYYGGDANFTNMQAYIVSMGFDNIISDKDFPLSEKTSKWGAHDDILFRRAFTDLHSARNNTPAGGNTSRSNPAVGNNPARKNTPGGNNPAVTHCAPNEVRSSQPFSNLGAPTFTVIQTSSSHEPFEVPYHNPLYPSGSEDNMRRNAFAFTDSCLFSFVDQLRTLPSWRNTLIVIVADHYGCYPRELPSAPDRHHIPFILLGGAIDHTEKAPSQIGMQTDIGATILSLLYLDPSRLKYSRDLFSQQTAPVAIFTEPSLVGIVTPTDTLVYNPDADAIISSSPGDAPLLRGAQAFLRSLYSTLDNLGRQ